MTCFPTYCPSPASLSTATTACPLSGQWCSLTSATHTPLPPSPPPHLHHPPTFTSISQFFTSIAYCPSPLPPSAPHLHHPPNLTSATHHPLTSISHHPSPPPPPHLHLPPPFTCVTHRPLTFSTIPTPKPPPPSLQEPLSPPFHPSPPEGPGEKGLSERPHLRARGL